MQKILFVGLGGFIGASLRYIISNIINKGSFTLPLGTLLVNILGGFFIGAIITLSLNSTIISTNLKLFLTTGLLGGLTTFSTFSLETLGLFENKLYFLGILNINLNLLLSLLGVYLGKILIKLFI
ncbi:MAG: fluoride efflux transporter CrcB [Clostridiaceae bacterium]